MQMIKKLIKIFHSSFPYQLLEIGNVLYIYSISQIPIGQYSGVSGHMWVFLLDNTVLEKEGDVSGSGRNSESIINLGFKTKQL